MKAARAYAGVALACLLAYLLAACSNRMTDGGGTEETNGSLAGAIVDGKGAPIAGARIFLRSPDFLKDTAGADLDTALPDALTDAEGRFSKEGLPPGAWSIEVRGDSEQAILLEALVAAGKRTEAPAAVLRKGGFLEGDMTLAPGGDHGFLQIYGLDRAIRTDDKGHFVARNLPAGALKTRFITARADLAYPDKETFAIASEDTTRTGFIPWLEAYSKWAHSRDLILANASLGLLHDVPGYPLLLRLDTSAIDFAQTNGSDLRIVNSAGRPLNHQIERWNAGMGKAEIWVKMELLHADSAEQHLKIFWGNPAAANLASGKRVFADYDGVWHMESPDCNPGDSVPAAGCRYSESSPSAIPAVGRAANRLGLIGPIAHFSGEPLRAPGKPALMPAKKGTVSAWFRADTGSLDDAVIATLGDAYGIKLVGAGDVQWYAFADTAWGGPGMPPSASWFRLRTQGLALRDGAWHHAAAVWDGATARIYIDGEESVSAAAKAPPAYRLGTQVSLGAALAAEPPSPFLGDLEEVRFAAEAWSLSRIRADFRFQRPGSKLTLFP